MPRRPVLYQVCRAGTVFEVGDGPMLLGPKPIVLGRGEHAATGPLEDAYLVEDSWMSSRHAQVSPLDRNPSSDAGEAGRRRDGQPLRYVIEDLSSTNGVLVNGVPTRRAPLLHGDLIETGRTFWFYLEESATDPLLTEPCELGGVATWTPSLARQLKELLPRVPGAEHALVSGPPGVGKGFLARTIHVVSGRAGRFLHLDCRSRRPKHLAADLFGEGTSGRLQAAVGGTLFLEHVDALPPDLQDRLVESLRSPGGSSEGRARSSASAVSARIVAAVDGVDEALAAGRLRTAFVGAFQDLHVRLPPLALRLPDMGLLIDDFLSRARGAPALSRDACRAVLKSSFRQNVRALARVIEAAATLAGVPDGTAGGERGSIELVHLPLDVIGRAQLKLVLGDLSGGPSSPSQSPSPSPSPSPERTSEMPAMAVDAEDVTGFDETDPRKPRQSNASSPRAPRRPPSAVHAPAAPAEPSDLLDAEQVAAALRGSHGNVSAAARSLGRPRAQLLRLMHEFGIDPRRQ